MSTAQWPMAADMGLRRRQSVCHSRSMVDDLDLSELMPAGGSWGGLLFSNPVAGVAPSLTWTFTFDFAEIEREYGKVTPGLMVDWAPLPNNASWHDLGAASVTCATFGEPIEASVYFFEHYRYDHVELSLLSQDAGRIQVRAVVSGDIDGLGIPELAAEASLDFEGIIVQLAEEPLSVNAAAIELARFTSVEGLTAQARWHNNYIFVPAGSSVQSSA